MADGSENIGGINISVGADYSQLLTDFQSMQTAASSAGAVVADSFTTAAEGVTTFDDAVQKAVEDGATLAEAIAQASQQFNEETQAAGGATQASQDFSEAAKAVIQAQQAANDQLSQAQSVLAEVQSAYEAGAVSAQTVARAAGDVQKAFEAANQSVQEVKAPVEDASLSLSGFVKGLIALQASLTALQGLKDFASSAIEASDSFKAAQISLANLTGSAAQANQTIGQLVTLAQQDGLSMPALLTAATRMQALIGASAPVPEILTQLANAGAVSGQGIDAAANAFDRIVTSGTAAARTLLPLGINLDDLAKSFNDLSGTSEATSQNVGSLLKTLDQPDRVQVLTDALNKLNGTAQQVANQTFGGQWNQLIAQWEEVLKSAGDAMAPLLTDLVQLAKTDLVPFAQAAAGAFKQFTDTISTVKNTIGGLIDSLKDLAGSVPAAKSAWDLFVESVSKYNTYSLAKDAINELALGVQTLFNITPGATSMTAAMNAELGKLQSAGTAAKGSIDLIGDSIKNLLNADKTTAAQFDTDVKAFDQITSSVANHTAVIKGNVAGLQDQWAALEKVNSVASGLPQALSSVSLALANDTMAAQKATLQYQAQSGAYEAVLSAYNHGSATLGQLDAAFDKMQQSEQAAAAAGAPVAGSIQAIDEQAAAAVNSTKILATNFGLVADQARAQKDELDNLNAAVLVDSQRLDLLVTQENRVAAQVAAGTAQYSQQLLIKQQVAAANQKLIDDTQALQTAELRAGNAAADAAGEIGQLQQAENEANLSLEQAKQKYDAGLISTEAYVSAQKSAVTAAVNLAVAAAQQAANIGSSTDALSAAASAAAGAAAKLQVITQAYKDQKASIDEVVSAQNAYITSELKLAEQQAVAGAGLQGVTDAVGLQDIALVKAQADVDKYTELQREGYDVASQLQSALSTLATAQDKYNSMVQAGNPLLVTQNQELKNAHDNQQTLAPAIDSTTTAIGRQVSALQQQAGALNDVATAVKGIEADMQAAFGSVTSAGGTINVQQGYHLGGGLVSGAGEFGTQSTQYGLYGDASTVAAQAKIQEQALYDQGYTPQAIAKAMSAPLDQVLADLGLKAAQAGQAKSQGSAVLAPAGTYNQALGQINASLGGSASSGLPTLAQAEAGVTAAQNALTAAMASSTTTSAQIQELQLILAQAQQTVVQIQAGGSTSTSTTTGSSSTPIASGGTYTSAAIDGGSYPAVTAHQASGEVWAVAGTASGSGGGGVSSTISTTVSQTIQQTGGTSGPALQAATQAIGGAVEQLATNSGQLLPIAQSMQQTAQASQQLATAVAGLLVHIGATGSSSGLPAVTGSSGTAYSVGTPTQTVAGGNPLGTAVPPPSSTPIANVPGYNPFGPTSSGPSTNSFQVNVDMRGALVGNSAQLQAQISDAVISSLTNKLFTSGARLTR